MLAAAAAVGVLGWLHQDLHHIVAALIGHIGLQPGDRYPALLLSSMDELLGADRRLLMLGASAYVLVRCVEAYGLWMARSWGVWLGAVSGALYVPFELWHLMHQPTAWSVLVVLGNLALVGFLVRQLRRRALAPAGGREKEPT